MTNETSVDKLNEYKMQKYNFIAANCPSIYTHHSYE